MTDWEAKYRRLESALFNSARLALAKMENETAGDERSYFAGYSMAMFKAHLAAVKIAREAEE